MSAYINFNGEKMGTDEVMKFVRVLYKDAEQMAGEYHGMNRSEKFRANWPDEDLFAKANWKTFVAAIRVMYAERLGDPKTPPNEARQMHLALVLEKMLSEGQKQMGIPSDNRLQLAPNTQQFEGDKYENRKIMEKFGGGKNLRAFLMGEAAKIAHLH